MEDKLSLEQQLVIDRVRRVLPHMTVEELQNLVIEAYILVLQTQNSAKSLAKTFLLDNADLK